LIGEVYHDYKSRAKRKGVSFELSRADIASMIFSPCFFCGEVGSNPRRPMKYDEIVPYNGLDRWDSKIGYETNNVRTCCKYCNRMKSDMDGEEFFARVWKLAKKWGESPYIHHADPMNGHMTQQALQELSNWLTKGGPGALTWRYPQP
jgi:hypothetical protein